MYLVDEILKVFLFVLYISGIGVLTIIAMRYWILIRYIKEMEKNGSEYYHTLKWQMYGLIYAVCISVVFLGIQSTSQPLEHLVYSFSRYIIYYSVFICAVQLYSYIAKHISFYPFGIK